MKRFMEDGRMDVPDFADPEWVMDLAFLVGQLITAAYDSVKAFTTKLLWTRTQLSVVMNMLLPLRSYSRILISVFPTFQLFADCISVDVDSAPSALQMELIDLQCNSELKAKFREAQGKADMMGQFVRELPQSFPELSKMFSQIIFGSTYLCKKHFSTTMD